MTQENQDSPATSDALAKQIDENLRRVYLEALDREIPEKFTKLLETLRQKTATE